MRVIAGEFRGYRLQAPPGDSIRPTTDRVKENLFNILQSRINFSECGVAVDLYSGSGALGLELLSRGVPKVLFIEKNPKIVEVIQKNMGPLVERGVLNASRYSLVKRNAETWIEEQKEGAFDLILADPPYRKKLLWTDYEKVLRCLKSTGLCVYEREAKEIARFLGTEQTEGVLEKPEGSFHYEVRSYGQISLLFLNRVLAT